MDEIMLYCGNKFNGYQIEGYLHTGFVSRVYLARNLETKEKEVLKVFR